MYVLVFCVLGVRLRALRILFLCPRVRHVGPPSRGNGDANAHHGQLQWPTEEAVLMLTSGDADAGNRVFSRVPTASRRICF